MNAVGERGFEFGDEVGPANPGRRATHRRPRAVAHTRLVARRVFMTVSSAPVVTLRRHCRNGMQIFCKSTPATSTTSRFAQPLEGSRVVSPPALESNALHRNVFTRRRPIFMTRSSRDHAGVMVTGMPSANGLAGYSDPCGVGEYGREGHLGRADGQRVGAERGGHHPDQIARRTHAASRQFLAQYGGGIGTEDP